MPKGTEIKLYAHMSPAVIAVVAIGATLMFSDRARKSVTSLWGRR